MLDPLVTGPILLWVGYSGSTVADRLGPVFVILGDPSYVNPTADGFGMPATQSIHPTHDTLSVLGGNKF